MRYNSPFNQSSSVKSRILRGALYLIVPITLFMYGHMGVQLLHTAPASWLMVLGFGVVFFLQPKPLEPHLLPVAWTIIVLTNIVATFVAYNHELIIRRSYRSGRMLKLQIARSLGLAKVARAASQESERASLSKSDFFARMSHELRTPLNAIIGFSDVMRSELFGPIKNVKYREYLSHIHLSGNHLLSLINDILDLSKVEAGRFPLNESECDIEEEVLACFSLVSRQSEDARVRLSYKIEPNAGRLRADRRMFRQILLNLLSNAIDFSCEGGQVDVSSRRVNDGGLTVSVRDRGTGIRSTDLDMVLEPFGQSGDKDVRGRRGTGLGLPIAKSLMQRHGGSLSVESLLGSGTTVSAIFPVERCIQ